MVRRITFSGEYEEGQKAFRMGYSFDPKHKSADFMEGYNEEKAAWYRAYAEYRRNSSLFS